MKNGWLAILSFVGLSQSLFAGAIVLMNKHKKPYDRIMFFWLLILGLRFWLVGISHLHGDFFDPGFSVAMVPLTFGPFLYLYTIYLLGDLKRHSPFDILHFVPFFLSVSMYFTLVQDTENQVTELFFSLIPPVFSVSATVYIILVFLRLRTFRQHIRQDLFSYENDANRLSWINYVAILFLITYVVYFVLQMAAGNFAPTNSLFEFVQTVGLLWLTYSLGYFGIRQPVLIQQREEDQEVVPMATIATKRVKDTKPGEATEPVAEQTEEIKDTLRRITRFMEEEKPYLQPELTLPELALRLNIPRHQLTQLLNQHVQKNFFEFVNEYRALEVMRRLQDEKFAHLTLVAIAYDCGFNTKSTFNQFFKQYSGQTPSEYRRNLISAKKKS
jgi:AraC-like DNA-binding protein